MNRSKDRHTFQAQAYIKRCKEAGEEVSKDFLHLYENAKSRDLDREVDEQWKQNNLEYDLRSTDWICVKAQEREEYAQNVYAALCNQEWQRNDVWPRLRGQTYSCSWRYAGGIVADMRQEGDYIDWYCSGIGGAMGGGSELDAEIEAAALAQRMFVPEGHVTDEVREDFFRLGWIPVDSKD